MATVEIRWNRKYNSFEIGKSTVQNSTEEAMDKLIKKGYTVDAAARALMDAKRTS